MMIRTGVLPHLGLLPFERLPMYPFFGSGVPSPSSSSQTSHEDYLLRSTFSPRFTNIINTTESEPRPMDNGFIWRSPRSPWDSPRVSEDSMIVQSSSTTTPVSSPRFSGVDELPTTTTIEIPTSSTSTTSSTTTTTTSTIPTSTTNTTHFHHSFYSSGEKPSRFAASSPPKSASPLAYSIPKFSSTTPTITFQAATAFPSQSASSSTSISPSPHSSLITMQSNPTTTTLVCRPQKRINFKLIQVDPSKETKRLKLPKSAIKVLSQWFAQHQDNPYPDDNDKTELAAQTNLTRTQINNWFSYARRRASKNKPPV